MITCVANEDGIFETGYETFVGPEIQVHMLVIAESLPRHRVRQRQCQQGEERSHPDHNVLVLLSPNY